MTRLICHSADITPPDHMAGQDVMLAGFASRTHGYTHTHDALEANLIVLEHDGQKQIYLSLDLLFIGQEIRNHADTFAHQFFETAPENLMVCASHTHYAPATDRTKPDLGRVSDAYMDYLHAQLHALFEQAAQMNAATVTIDKKHIPMRSAVNRRRKGWHIDPARLRLVYGVYMAPNYDETRHDTAHLLRFIDETQTIRAILWSYGCHPTSFPDQNNISAEYPGIVRDDIRSYAKSAIPVVFLQGMAGDKRAPEVGGGISLKGRIRRSIGGPHFGNFDMNAYTKWAHSLSTSIINGLKEPQKWHKISPYFSSKRLRIDLRELIDGQTPQDFFNIHKMQISQDLIILGMSAEPVTAYEDIIRQELSLPAEDCISIGYIDDVFGYLPTHDMVEEGGYEAAGFFKPFGLSGTFRDNFENPIRDALRKLSTNHRQEDAA